MMTDYMLKEYEQGAALRQISKTGEEVLYQTINRSEMYDGPVGLPRFDISLSLTQALSALGVSSFSGNDVVTVRFVLNLTDGRSFSRTNVTGSMTGA